MTTKVTSSNDIAMDAAIFRSFNRMYTKFIGTLNEVLLESEYGLAEARVLYELANRERPKAIDLRDELGLDAGYLSRILTKFERDGLLKRKASNEDARAAELALTAAGKTAFRQLNQKSEKQAREILGALGDAERHEVVQSMKTIQRALTPLERKKSYTLRGHCAGDMGTVVRSEGIGYAEQFGWDETFEALVAQIVSEFVMKFDAQRERCWIAEVDGRHAGHIFLVKHPERVDTAKLRLLFVEPWARGMRLGDTLVTECVKFARAAGYKRIVLWTQSMLKPAIRIYERAGFRLTAETPHHSFGKDLIGQEWHLDLEIRKDITGV